jgi:hypothetical protein
VSLPWAEFLFSDGFHWQEWDRPRVIVRTQRAGLKNLLHSVVYSCFNKNQMISPRVAFPSGRNIVDVLLSFTG